MDNSENMNTLPPREAAESLYVNANASLRRAVEIVRPENPETDPLQAFPAPNERRDDDPGLQLTEKQEADLRQTVSEFGFGRTTDRKASEVGLTNGNLAFIEGGQVHKVIAEIGNALEDSKAIPDSLVIGASPNRAINNPAEVAITSRLLNIEEAEVGKTEYDVAKQIVERMDGFVALKTPEELPFSYDIHNDYAVSPDNSGQFVAVGRVGETSVVIARIDRENYVDEEGKDKYRKQPDSAAILLILDGVLGAAGDEEKAIALHTSSTYQASRDVDGARASIATSRSMGIATYGAERMAAVRGEDVPAPAPINQLPGELHKAALQLQLLRQAIDSTE